MGIRGEIFSTKVALQNRTYFFNVKENRMGDLYLNIVESKNRESGGFERQSVILFADDLREFLTGFDESLRILEKAAREKRKGDRPPRQADAGGHPPRQAENNAGERPRFKAVRKGGERTVRTRSQGERPSRERPSRSSGDKPYDKPKRRVVRRKD